MSLRLTVLGCTGSWPGPTGACSGYLLRSARSCLMIDCGPGTFSHLQRHVDLSEVTGVVLTHAHPDHWSDFGVMRNAWKYGLGLTGLPVYAPQELIERAPALVGNEPGGDGAVDWIPVADGQTVTHCDVRLTFSATEHYVETLAVRVDEFLDPPSDPHAEPAGPPGREVPSGTSLVYTADTGPGWSAAELGVGVDVLLCEATSLLRDDPDLQHLTAGEAGLQATSADAGRLLLTHLPLGAAAPEYRRAAEDTFPGPVEVVVVHTTYQL